MELAHVVVAFAVLQVAEERIRHGLQHPLELDDAVTLAMPCHSLRAAARLRDAAVALQY